MPDGAGLRDPSGQRSVHAGGECGGESKENQRVAVPDGFFKIYCVEQGRCFDSDEAGTVGDRYRGGYEFFIRGVAAGGSSCEVACRGGIQGQFGDAHLFCEKL